MSLLEVITKAAMAEPSDPAATLPQFPVVLNPDPIFPLLKPDNDSAAPAESRLVQPVSGWQISDPDARLIASTGRFFAKLSRKLKKPESFARVELLGLLIGFVEENGDKFGAGVGGQGCKDASRLAARLAVLMGPELTGVVCECCAVVESWSLLEGLISLGCVRGANSRGLFMRLFEKRKAYLICLCIKKISNVQPQDLAAAMKFFLSLRTADSTKEVRKEWENQAIKAVEKVEAEKGSHVGVLAKRAAILLAVAYDEFDGWELGLHYLIGSSVVGGAALAWAVAELEGPEVVKMVRYLGKWLAKYERLPEAGPCLEAADELGLEACRWVPSLEAVVTCAGAVIDEHFSYLVLVLKDGFGEEVREMEERVRRLALEAKLGCGMAKVIENLRELESA